MTSAINPNNIDGQYPVAGQDNNSQGFRDNFTNTKTNFQYAKDEITQLQNASLLKSALPGSSLNNNMGNDDNNWCLGVVGCMKSNILKCFSMVLCAHNFRTPL